MHNDQEKPLFFLSIVVTRKDGKMMPTYTTIVDEELKKEITFTQITKFNIALRRLSEVIAEMLHMDE